jgi:hypothetical protein
VAIAWSLLRLQSCPWPSTHPARAR